MYQKTNFKNGLRLLTVNTESIESVTVVVYVKAGGRYELIEKSGLSHFIEHTVFKGTVRRPRAKDIAVEIEQYGGVHNAATSHEFTYYYIKVPKEKIEVAFDVLSDILYHPQFENKAVERERQVILEEINVYNDSPMDKVGDYLFETMWPDHPLGTELTGTKEQFMSITRDDVLKYMDTFYHPNNMLVVVSGNFKAQNPSRLVEKYFLSRSSKPIPSFDKVVEKQQKPQIKFHYKDTDQTHFFIGIRSFAYEHPDRFALDLLTTVLGKGMSSRLFEILREQNGLCYYVSAGVESFSDTGVFYIRAGVDNQRYHKSIALIMKELKKLKTARVPKKELQKAKEYLKGRLKLSLESTESQANFYGVQELLLEKVLTPQDVFAKIDAVSNDDIMRLANDLFINERLNLVSIGPEKDIEKFQTILTF